nr:hypothetical protein [Deltaproteobacteria bacterium]
MNPVRLRRLFSELEARREALRGGRSRRRSTEIRKQTVTEDIELPAVDLDADIGGCTR